MLYHQNGHGAFRSPLVLDVYGLHQHKTETSFGFRGTADKRDIGALALSAAAVSRFLLLVDCFLTLRLQVLRALKAHLPNGKLIKPAEFSETESGKITKTFAKNTARLTDDDWRSICRGATISYASKAFKTTDEEPESDVSEDFNLLSDPLQADFTELSE